MNLYQRIALANPQGAREVIKSYGYDIRTSNLPQALRMLVGAEGENALRSIVNIHPDKEIILECFAKNDIDMTKATKHDHDDCGCNKTKSQPMESSYLNAVGNVTEAQKQTQLTNTFLIVSAIMVLGALIIKNQK
jgi:hypothetical protein